MAPKYRQLHAKTLDSFDFNELPDDFARVSWLLLPLIVDSEGRGINNPAWIRSKMFPLRPDVSLEQIQDAFNWFNKRKMIIIYEVEGRSYFCIPKWKNYQSGTEKEAKSGLPACPDLLLTNSGVGQELPEVPALYCIESVNEFGNKDQTPLSKLHAAFFTGFGRDAYSNEQDDWFKTFGEMSQAGVIAEDITTAFVELGGKYTITSPKSIKAASITCKNKRLNPQKPKADAGTNPYEGAKHYE